MRLESDLHNLRKAKVSGEDYKPKHRVVASSSNHKAGQVQGVGRRQGGVGGLEGEPAHEY